jgi:hypothetical protein
MKASMIETQIRAARSLARTELLEVREFCREAESFFKRNLKRFGQSVKEEPDSDEEMFLSDHRMELEGRVELTGYFGAIMVFSALERFSHRIYQSTVTLALKPELADVVLSSRDRRLNFNEFKDFLKRLGVDTSGKQFDWNGINELQRLRNAIVHQGGIVTEANLNFLRPYGYKEWERVSAPMTYVHESIRLVEDATKAIGDAYLAALRKRKLIDG